jgi:4-hydroxy-tetrahydrodipicolinate reductase
VIRVAVFGAAGRMGTTICSGLAAAPDVEVVAAVDPAAAGRSVQAGHQLVISADVAAAAEAGAEVAVDFTRASAAMDNLRWCAGHGLHAVCGTSGLSPADLDELAELFGGAGGAGGAAAGGSGPNGAWIPNFAVGAVLMMHVATLVAPHLDSVEIIELHHDGKIDAPSGTAAATAGRLTEARRAAGVADWPGDHTSSTTIAGARGAAGEGGVRIHSVRLPGLVAHQEVLFGAPGQTLSIRHDTYDRACFVPGVLLAVRGIASRPGFTVGLDSFLGL